MSVVRKLDLSGDWTWGSGVSNYTSGLQALEQLIRTRILTFAGEWFRDLTFGVNWALYLGYKQSQLPLLNADIKQNILDYTPEVKSIVNYSSSYDKSNGLVLINMTIDTIYGEVDINGVSINV